METAKWSMSPIFRFLQRIGTIPEDEMYRTFNMGIGLLVIVDEAKANDIRHHFEAVGEEAYIIGEIAPMEEGATDTVEIRR